jgi:hypothetical protein
VDVAPAQTKRKLPLPKAREADSDSFVTLECCTAT